MSYIKNKEAQQAMRIVRKIHPEAKQSGSIWRNPNCEVFPDDSGDSICIGRGDSPADAWLDAARRLK